MRKTHTERMVEELKATGMTRPIIQYGERKWISYKDYTKEVLAIVGKEGYYVGNDAPRGGAMGKFIKKI